MSIFVFDKLIGKTISKIAVSPEKDEAVFVVEDVGNYRMHHPQDCCESVLIDDIVGDLKDLIGLPLTMAEVVDNEGENADGSFTWTFYKFATEKGCVTIKWYGSSNGYYSEKVSFELV